MPQNPIPTTLPASTTPNTYSGTLNTAYLLKSATQTTWTRETITVGALAAAAATSITVTALTAPIPSGTVLDFGGVKATLTADADIADAALTVAPLTAAIANASTAIYTDYDEIPLAESYTATLADNEESISVHGRATPIRTMNGKDFTAMIKTVAGIDEPVVKRLVALGMQLSPGCRARILFQWTDGFCLLVDVNIGAPKPSGNPGQSNRYEFGGNLAGDLYWIDRNETTPAWKKVGALVA